MEYSYVEISPKVWAPMVPLQFWAGDRWYYSMAYVDSGANTSVFQMKIAKALGLARKDGKLAHVTVGDGDKMPILIYPLKVKFSNLVFTAAIGFSDQLGVDFDIIGRTSFFERFRICFNEHDKVVSTLRLF